MTTLLVIGLIFGMNMGELLTFFGIIVAALGSLIWINVELAKSGGVGFLDRNKLIDDYRLFLKENVRKKS